jgi:hypothetical protein
MISNRKLNLFETIEFLCHDLDFAPHAECQPTAAPPGSLEKIQVMCERLANGQELHHEGDMRTTASMELQHDMATAMIVAAKIQREESRVRRAEAQPKRVMALHAARATKQREAEVRKTKSIIRITRGSK